MYRKGKGVTQDYAKAVKWYHKAAEKGYVKAQFNLGLMYGNGEGVTQDYAEAVRWYRKAAKQGHAKAQFNLGSSHGNGEGVLQDTIAAHMWWNIAAENGLERAVKIRVITSGKLSSSGAKEAQKMAKRCMASGYKDCE